MARFVAETVILQHHRDTGQDRVVELADAVGRQEEQAAEVLEPSQEDGYDGVAPNVPRDASFEKGVGFVEQEDRVPVLREREPFLQFLVDVVSVFQEVVHAESDEGAACRLRDAFHTVCFADAWGTMEKDDLAFAFLLNGVKFERVGVAVGYGLDDGFIDGVDEEAFHAAGGYDLRQPFDVQHFPSFVIENETCDQGLAEEVVAVRGEEGRLSYLDFMEGGEDEVGERLLAHVRIWALGCNLVF